MKKYTPENPMFSNEIDLVERADLVNSQNHNTAIKQLIGNEVALKKRLDSCIGSTEGDGLQFVEGLDADNFLDAINQTFQLGSEKKTRLAENLTAMGLQASASDTWEVLLNKVLDMTDTSKDTVRASVLLAGYTAHDAAGKPITGDMEECGAWTGNTTGSGNVAIPAGHHNGKGYVSGKGAYDAGVNATKKGTAVAADVLAGKTFTNNSAVGANGGMAEHAAVTVDATNTTQDADYTYLEMPEGHYNAQSKVRTKNSNLAKKMIIPNLNVISGENSDGEIDITNNFYTTLKIDRVEMTAANWGDIRIYGDQNIIYDSGIAVNLNVSNINVDISGYKTISIICRAIGRNDSGTTYRISNIELD